MTPELKAETKKKILHLGGTLFLITAVTGLILGVVEWGTRIAIEKAEAEAKAEALRNVMPEATSFAAATLADGAGEMLAEVQQAMDKNGSTAGWCLSISSKGYGGPVNFVVGIANDGTIRGINILSHSETPGLGARSTEPEFYGQFAGKKAPIKVVKGTAEAENEIAAISGATITSTAVTNGVNAAAEYWDKNLKGK
ncbi:MAG: RnfABCDGE type electron transport complex subunit G [Fretibacterium sp.]|nr:RnfABCDGE type electron transport complex subunit G [Fretibacterium sp.]